MDLLHLLSETIESPALEEVVDLFGRLFAYWKNQEMPSAQTRQFQRPKQLKCCILHSCSYPLQSLPLFHVCCQRSKQQVLVIITSTKSASTSNVGCWEMGLGTPSSLMLHKLRKIIVERVWITREDKFGQPWFGRVSLPLAFLHRNHG